MNHITTLRIMIILVGAFDVNFHWIAWLYASALEIEWWSQQARHFILENQAIAASEVQKEPNELSENE